MEINIWSVVVAAGVAVFIRAVWVLPVLFVKERGQLLRNKYKKKEENKRKGIVKFYIIQLVVTFITFCILGFAMSAIETQTASDGAIVGVLAWLGFIFPISVGVVIWERQPFKLVLINTVNMLLSLVVGGAIICAW